MSNAFPGVTDSPEHPNSNCACRSRNRLVFALTVFLSVGLIGPANAHLRTSGLRTTGLRTTAISTVAVKTSAIRTSAINATAIKTSSIRTAPIKAATRAVKVKTKSPTSVKASAKPLKPTKKPKALKPTAPSTSPDTTVPNPEATETTTTAPQARVLPVPVVAAVSAGVVTTVTQPAVIVGTPAVLSPLPTPAATILLVGAGTAITTPPVTTAQVTTPPVTTTTLTTLPPAPFPAPADPPKRASAATLDPYRGLGTWIDKLDWSNLYSKNKPVVSLATVDQIAAAGVQTIYLQIPSYQITSPDIYEPERLLPLIDRAHALGMYVVGWYLPALLDVNTDLRKVVAMANLDLDGIQIDIEKIDFTTLKDFNVRNARMSEFNRSVRSLLPGRVVTADVIAPGWADGQAGRWAWPNYPAAARAANWPGFNYTELVATYDLTALQVYWTENSANSGWRDAQIFTLENMNRMRAYAGRVDYPIQAIGGVKISQSPLNDLVGYIEAARAAGSVGASLYDWTTTPASWWPALWGFRSVVDPRFPAPVLPPYIPLAQPATPPVTTTTTTKPPTNVPAAVTSTTALPLVEVVLK
jgi:hypothetical protein